MACVQIITFYFYISEPVPCILTDVRPKFEKSNCYRLKLVKNCHLAVHMLHTSIIFFAVKWPRAKHCNSMCQWLSELPRRLIEDDKRNVHYRIKNGVIKRY